MPVSLAQLESESGTVLPARNTMQTVSVTVTQAAAQEGTTVANAAAGNAIGGTMAVGGAGSTATADATTTFGDISQTLTNTVTTS